LIVNGCEWLTEKFTGSGRVFYPKRGSARGRAHPPKTTSKATKPRTAPRTSPLYMARPIQAVDLPSRRCFTASMLRH
jgi:hypothetical protein